MPCIYIYIYIYIYVIYYILYILYAICILLYVYILYIYYTYTILLYIYTYYIYHSHTHWSNLFRKLLLMNDFHSSLLAIFCSFFHLLAPKKACCAQFLHNVSTCVKKILTDNSVLFL